MTPREELQEIKTFITNLSEYMVPADLQKYLEYFESIDEELWQYEDLKTS